MGWKWRGGRAYYYRSVWEQGRTRSQYMGKALGPLMANVQATLGKSRAFDTAYRAWQLRECERQAEAEDGPLVAFDAAVEAVAHAVLERAGYHRHKRGPWRRRRTMKANLPAETNGTPATRTPFASALDDPDALYDLLQRAQRGDASTLPEIQAFLDSAADSGDLDGAVYLLRGDVARSAEEAMVGRWNGEDLAGKEATHRKLASLRTELAGPNPTPIEDLLAARVALDWFWLYRLEASVAAAKNQTPLQTDFQQRRIDRAHRRYLASLRTLATVRKLALPTIQVNVGEQQVNVAGR